MRPQLNARSRETLNAPRVLDRFSNALCARILGPHVRAACDSEPPPIKSRRSRNLYIHIHIMETVLCYVREHAALPREYSPRAAVCDLQCAVLVTFFRLHHVNDVRCGLCVCVLS